MWLHSSCCSERAGKGEALPPASVNGRFAGLTACAIACRLHRDDRQAVMGHAVLVSRLPPFATQKATAGAHALLQGMTAPSRVPCSLSALRGSQEGRVRRCRGPGTDGSPLLRLLPAALFLEGLVTDAAGVGVAADQHLCRLWLHMLEAR